MNALEKINLIDKIGRELQARMTFREIESYFKANGIKTDQQATYNSKYVYVKEILPNINDKIVIQIANELNIEHNFHNNLPTFKDETTTFWKTGHFKLFISHLSSFKETIEHLKIALEKFGISSFVAHIDIEPTKEWQEEIEKGLFSMDALCAVLMPGFKDSNWTDQEIGVAIGRGVLVIPVRKGLEPYGFIGKFQGYQSFGKNIEQVADGVFTIISKNPKSRNIIISCLINLLLLSTNKIEVFQRISALEKIDDLPKDKILHLKTMFTENQNLKDIEIIKRFNELAQKYDVKGVQIKDFEKIVEIDENRLPF